MTRARDLADSADKDIAGTLTLDDLSVSGTVTGNVTGDLTGDVTGDVTGNLTGDVTGGLTGNVTGDVDLYAIAATIADTAVDIFVYDTRKDSDGGQWRHRCQHTSWYNETLNTATRGSRKEFPSVAVIVAESALGGNVNIYDGDDPDMPLWMTFNNTGVLSWATGSSINLLSVAALNGIVFIGTNAQGGVHIDFNKDYIRLAHSSNSYGLNGDRFILNRNSSGIGYVSGSDGYNLVNYTINDVAMTVLPNAPIDAATGLPVPTIAVATDGGYSIIKDDGTVVDGTCSQSLHNKVGKIKFTEDNRVAYLGFHYNLITRSRFWRIDDIISTDTVITTNVNEAQNSAEFYANANNIASNDKLLKVSVNPQDYGYAGYVEANENTFVAGNNEGVSLVDRNKTKPSDGMVSFLASSYQTGYQVGDIKLATLSDTDATNVTGSELVTNGTFDTDVSGWSNNPTELLTWNSSGYADIDRNGGSSQGQCYQYITTEIGKSYVVAVDVLAVSNGFQVYYDGNSMPSTSGSTVTNTTGTFYWFFTAQSTSTKIDLSAVQSSTATASVDNVSVKLAEADRSVNGNGLQVFGTVTKSAVATGADLVGYSGFSSSNYLVQPYNSGLDWGTSDFVVMGWENHSTTASQTLINIGDVGSNNSFDLRVQNNVYNAGYLSVANAFASTYSITPSAPSGTWNHVAVVHTGGLLHFYVNGVHAGSWTDSSINWTTHWTTRQVIIGIRGELSTPANATSMALWRISATAPSPGQIKKIYEDEKVLFQENAQATLYGSSDAVTALAYDDSTELLHVGTSAGRSVFQGLKRVDNTTTAVGAAISASNGLVADE